jgi:hypothetical protein
VCDDRDFRKEQCHPNVTVEVLPDDTSEGVLSPTRPPLKGMTRLNAVPRTAAHQKRLHTPKPLKVPHPIKPVARIKPTIRHIAEILPQRKSP